MTLFYELLRVSVGQQDCLSRGPSDEEWHELWDVARRQQLAGICYHGVERLFEYGLRAPQDVSIDWMADAEQIRENNERTLRRCQLVQRRLAERSLRSAVLSEQAVASCYPAELQGLLQPAGVELYVDCDVQRIVRIVELTGQPTVHYDRQGAVLLEKWADTPFKLHHEIVFRTNPLRSGATRRWFRRQAGSLFTLAGGLTAPSQQVALVCRLLAMQRSLMEGCATMRQIVDLYFLLRQLDGQFAPFEGGQSLEAAMRSLGIWRLARGLMWVLQQVLLMDRRLMVGNPLESEGRFVLSQVMSGRHWWTLLCRHPLLTLCNLGGDRV